MSETFISMDDIIDRIVTHKDVNNTHKSNRMLIKNNQVLVRKPRAHIIKSKQLTPIKNIFDSM